MNSITIRSILWGIGIEAYAFSVLSFGAFKGQLAQGVFALFHLPTYLALHWIFSGDVPIVPLILIQWLIWTTVAYGLYRLAGVIPLLRRVSPFRHPVAQLALLAVLAMAWSFLTYWPFMWVQHQRHREKVLERVQAVGGWEVIQRECDALAEREKGKEEPLYWLRSRGPTNLPPVLFALNPSRVEFIPSLPPDLSDNSPQVPVVRIKMFGMHSTGGISQPYFGLEVACGPLAKEYRPRPSNGGTSGNGYRTYRRVTDRIYEIY